MKEVIDFVGLGFILIFITSLAFFLKNRYVTNFDKTIKSGIKTYSSKQIIIGVCLLLPMGLWIIINFPIQHVIILEVATGATLISFTAYILTKNKLAVASGILYPVLYYYHWNIFTLNCIAAFIALGTILILNRYIKPKEMLLLCGLIIVYDFIAVYITTDMVSAAYKIIESKLPMFLYVKLTPAKGIFLGLGDVLILGLLVLKIAEWKNYSLRTGLNFIFVFCSTSIICLAVAIQITPVAVPATIPIMMAAGLSIVFFEMKAFSTTGGL